MDFRVLIRHSPAIFACLKHFVGYGARREGGRDYDSTEIGLFSLRNIYLPSFKAGIDAGALTLMSAFNSLNNVPTSGNHFTLNKVLREEWKFSGLVVSDFDSVGSLVHHGYAADAAEAGAISLNAGVDMEMVGDCYHKNLASLMDSGQVSEATVDEAVRRVLRLKFKLGLFERPYTDNSAVVDEAAKESRIALAQEAAAKCAVLLKNTGELPIQTRTGTLALIGPLADAPGEMLGAWHGLGRSEDVVTLKSGLATALPGMNITFALGCGLTNQNSQEIEINEAVSLADAADLVVLALGEPARWSGERGSRMELGLSGWQQELFDRVAATGKPIVTVLFAGRPLSIPTVMSKSSAVLLAWQPGIQAGAGIADVLLGTIDPSGRLTTSLPYSVGQVPVYYNHLPTKNNIEEMYKDGTRWPLLPFGYGLTYTTFSYSPTRLSADTISLGDSITMTATITNTGKRVGTETVQLYLRDVACSLGARPVRE